MPERPDPVPDLDWSPERARQLGEEVVGLWSELLERLPELPVNRPFEAAAVRDAVALPVPEDPTPLPDLVSHQHELLFEQSMYAGHPRFLAYISGAGTVPGAAADMVAAALNANVGGYRLSPGATEVELALTRWLADQFGLPATAGGQIVSGGAMANLVSLKAARDAAAAGAVREAGVRGQPEPAIYASGEAHVVIQRAADLLGLGSDSVRVVPVDRAWRMRVDSLREAIEADVEAGAAPVAVVATTGTTATGSIDPVEEIADVCSARGIWLHVDAAYGGPAVLADDLRPLLHGIERADSIAVDPHKWLYTPLAGGCVLVRDMARLADAYGTEASYVWMPEDARQGVDLAMMGPEFSRGFSALKVWISLLAHGRAAYARRISHDAALARYLGGLVEAHPHFRLMAPVSLSVCCFRYAPPELGDDEEAIDRLNERIMTAIQADGRAYCSNAVLGGRFCLRACVVNFRTEAEDLERLLQVTEERGRASLG